MVSKYHPAYLTSCLWSQKRPGIFFITRHDGWLNAYDLVYKTNDVAFSYKIGDEPLTCSAINAKGSKIAVGDEEGKISIVKLSKSFYHIASESAATKLKKEFITKMFERETAREKSLEIKKKGKEAKDETNKQSKQEQLIKDKIRKIEEQYLPFVNSIMAKSDYQKELEAEQKEEEKKRQLILEREIEAKRQQEEIERIKQESLLKEKEQKKVSEGNLDEEEIEKNEDVDGHDSEDVGEEVRNSEEARKSEQARDKSIKESKTEKSIIEDSVKKSKGHDEKNIVELNENFDIQEKVEENNEDNEGNEENIDKDNEVNEGNEDNNEKVNEVNEDNLEEDLKIQEEGEQ